MKTTCPQSYSEFLLSFSPLWPSLFSFAQDILSTDLSSNNMFTSKKKLDNIVKRTDALSDRVYELTKELERRTRVEIPTEHKNYLYCDAGSPITYSLNEVVKRLARLHRMKVIREIEPPEEDECTCRGITFRKSKTKDTWEMCKN
jgi:hypothetical protein